MGSYVFRILYLEFIVASHFRISINIWGQLDRVAIVITYYLLRDTEIDLGH